MNEYDHEMDAIRTEWMAFFDRIAPRLRRVGAREALTNLMINARTQIGVDNEQESQPTDSTPRTRRVMLQKKPREGGRTRAASGSIRATVEKVLRDSLAPVSVPGIIMHAQDILGETLKDTSVRMALKSLLAEGKVEQNRIKEWLLVRRDAVAAADQPPSRPEVVFRAA